MEGKRQEETPVTKRRKLMIPAVICVVLISLVVVVTVTIHEKRLVTSPNTAVHEARNASLAQAGSSLRPSAAPSFSPSLLPSSVPSSMQPSIDPTSYPSIQPSTYPSSFPSMQPSSDPTSYPSTLPSDLPSDAPSSVPTTNMPSSEPTAIPSVNPSFEPSIMFPTVNPTAKSTTLRPTGIATYNPGDLTVNQLGLLLSTGLSARVVARTNQTVLYHNGERSQAEFHGLPDYGATFSDPSPENPGGWVYVSNSEIRTPRKLGGVGALTFNKRGELLEYKMVLTGTTANCAGGRTPWGSYITCEEYAQGNIWQVDPFGKIPSRRITLGKDPGLFESFAYDARHSHSFVTEDHLFGPLRRFTPDRRNTVDPWNELHGAGTTHYLLLKPGMGAYEWTTDKDRAKTNANLFYPNAEGLDVHENLLYFVSKRLKTMFILNLDDNTYTSHTTRRGVFDGQPDQLQRVLGPAGHVIEEEEDLLYFTEDGGKFAGVHARNRQGNFFTILESPQYSDETTGLAFSPDGMFMYVAYQDEGILFEVVRDDNLPFHAKSLTIKYHAMTGRD